MPYADDLFQRTLTESDIDNYIRQAPEEKLYLDFKEFPLDPTGEHQQKWFKEQLGKALSGFANSDGGVLVFGVNDKRRPVPHRDFKDFSTRLNEQLSRQVTPPVAGVVSKSIESIRTAGAGYVLLLVPASDSAPHRHRDDREYYKRSGDSFVRMEHYEIADMFGRRHHPKLQLRGVLEPWGSAVVFKIFLRNTGRAMARFPAVEVLGHQEGPFLYDGGATQRSPFADQTPELENFHGGANDVVHAQSQMLLWRCDAKSPDSVGAGTVFVLKARIAAQGFPATVVELCVTKRNLRGLEPGKTIEVDSKQ